MSAPIVTEQVMAWGTNVDVGYIGFLVKHGDFIQQGLVTSGISWFERDGWDPKDVGPWVPTYCFVVTGARPHNANADAMPGSPD